VGATTKWPPGSANTTFPGPSTSATTFAVYKVQLYAKKDC
jgi:hypothetical protein